MKPYRKQALKVYIVSSSSSLSVNEVLNDPELGIFLSRNEVLYDYGTSIRRLYCDSEYADMSRCDRSLVCNCQSELRVNADCSIGCAADKLKCIKMSFYRNKRGCPCSTSRCLYVEITDRREAIAYVIDHGQPGDVIVLAGKGHEDYQEIKGKKYPMDERVIIAEILESRK
jgi:hypothetical protein